MANEILWQSHSHGNQLLTTLVCAPMLVALLGFCFGMHFLGFGPVPIVMIVLFVISFIATIIIGRKRKWHNPKLIFSLSEEYLYATSEQNLDSYFYESYGNIEKCVYKDEKNNYVTVSVFFITPTNAGSLGNLKSLQMVKVENKDVLLNVLKSHGIPCINAKVQPSENNN